MKYFLWDYLLFEVPDFQGKESAILVLKESLKCFIGDDEQSTQMAASWEDEKVTEASSNSFVAIKIDTKRFAMFPSFIF